MAQRDKRSISLPPKLASAIAEAAEAHGTTFSAWLAETAAHRLKLEAGRRGIGEWEKENGALSEAERAEARKLADALLGKRRSGRRSAPSA